LDTFFDFLYPPNNFRQSSFVMLLKKAFPLCTKPAESSLLLCWSRRIFSSTVPGQINRTACTF
jgi:hypothetical protein